MISQEKCWTKVLYLIVCSVCAQGRRVLLAEDNLINQTVAKKMLTVLGLVCEVACNGQEAVDLARAGASDGRPFDVVLMDMAMPVMNGTEACRVRALEESPI